MRRLVDIDLVHDQDLQSRMVWGSMLVLAAGALLGVIGAVALPHEAITVGWVLALGLVSLLALPVHELVHAAAFKLLSGFGAKVRFGFTDWMLYTSAAGTILPRRRFCAVLLAPSILVTVALFAGAASFGAPLLGWALSVVHLAGCTGDWAMAAVIARERHAELVLDTEDGIALFSDS